jgi:soluble lytic murein transglycosylase
MRNKFLILGLLVTIVLFQNFASFDIAFDPKYKINDEVRREHAKELLGKKFKKSLASEETNESSLTLEVYNLVYRHTPKKYNSKVEKITKAILEESIKYNIDPVFVASIIKTESGFNPLAKGTSGEIGLMQLMPKTGEYIAKKIKMKKMNGAKTLRDPVKNIKIGVAYLNYLRQRFDNQAYKYVPAYNMGPGNVMKSINRKERPKIYSSKVIKYYESFYRQIYVSQMFKNPYLAKK